MESYDNLVVYPYIFTKINQFYNKYFSKDILFYCEQSLKIKR